VVQFAHPIRCSQETLLSQNLLVKCPKCQQRLQVKPLATESRVTCPKCQTVLKIGAEKPAVSQPSTPAAQAIPTPAPRPASNRVQRQPPAPAGFEFPATPATGSIPGHAPRPRTGSNASFPGARPSGPRKTGSKSIPKPVLIGGVAVALVLLLGGIVGAAIMLSSGANDARTASSSSNSNDVSGGNENPSGSENPSSRTNPPRRFGHLIPKTSYEFPDLGEPLKVYPSGVRRYFVEINLPGQRHSGEMQFHVWIPAGEHAERSLPSVLVAPAGTNLLHGASLSRTDDYDKETLPYAEAGMIAVMYSLDGGLPDNVTPGTPMAMRALVEAYPKFATAAAGIANAVRAREFVLQKIETAAPEKLHYAGHSSAANVALLTGAWPGPPIGGVIAYAGAYDLQARLADLTNDPAVYQMFGNLHTFVITSSPKRQVAGLRCPVFVFHARDDSNVPFQHAEEFVSELKQADKNVTFETVTSGGHYSPMINTGIPRAIAWIEKQHPS